MTRSKPASLAAAITSGRALLISEPKSRVARLRMNTRWPCCHGPIAFMRMRSPSSAPPLLRREGSMEITATLSASPWSSRRRRISSSVRLDLPAPPVPVMPRTGVLMSFAAPCRSLTSAASALPFSSAVINWASARQAASVWPWIASSDFGAWTHRSWSAFITISPIMPARPMRWPSSGLKMRTPCSFRPRISAGTITPPPPPKTLDLPAAALSQQLDHVLEVFDVPALVGTDRDALSVFLQRGGDDLVHRAVVAQVDHLGAHRLQDAPHDVDRRVVAVEQAGGGDEAHLVGGAVLRQCFVFSGQVGHCLSPEEPGF